MSAPLHDHGQLGWARRWLTAEHDTVTVPVASLQPGHSPRLDGESKPHTKMMAEAGEMPPIIVHQPTMQVIDGLHRLRAAGLRGQDSIAVRWFEGTADEAFVLAVAANTTHGMPLTLKERKAAAVRILGIYPDWSDRMIADIAGLSHHTVAGLRRKNSGGQIAHLNRRLGRDGKSYSTRSRTRRHPDQTASTNEGEGQAGVVAGAAAPQAQSPRQASIAPMMPTTRTTAALGVHLARGQAVLKRLWNNPAVRSPQKTMLELLSHSLRTASEAQAASRNAPEHCRDAVAEFASIQSDSWSQVAHELRANTQTG